ncbi:phospho-sugar mutase [Alicyclobacillus mengziensis]|uniref:Phosphoglucomutase n=2 Tax=Alicyclobacillus mengziensis TaxID=2931921 RepID=A0A9X7W3R9_9BACL|nr:phospho-sugar mutase [Alicyclobacillus mengziensis]
MHQPHLPASLKQELESIAGDEAAIQDRFYRDLEFGTGGLRGVLGAGTNRMNIFTVRRATAGFGEYLLERAKTDGISQPAAVVGYDPRRMSREFAEEVGRVFAAKGIVAYVFEHLCPTPEVSFAVRHLLAQGGVMITASHNPPEYNGYKVYDKHGCQVLPDDAEIITNRIEAISDLFSVPTLPLEEAIQKGLFHWISKDVDAAYEDMVVEKIPVASVSQSARDNLHIVYTPLHGTGNVPVRDVLRMTGYQHVTVVPEQAEPDGGFSTVKSPNPEEAAALAMAVHLASQTKADIAMGTDPDADRVGIAVRTKAGEYQLFSGNQVGGLLVDFVLHRRKEEGTLPEDGVVLKTIVTSELGAASARQLGVSVEDTLTGFKYIGDRIEHYEKTGTGSFLFGYEESYGYLAQGFVRDKDAVQICLLIAEMAAFYKSKGLTLVDALEDLYERVGYFEEKLISETFPGAEGHRKITGLIEGLREHGLSIEGMELSYVEDYETRKRTKFAPGGTPVGGTDGANAANAANAAATEPLTLPQSDVLKYVFTNGSWLAVRPSGTEPKIKFYVGAKGDSRDACTASVETLKAAVKDILDQVR